MKLEVNDWVWHNDEAYQVDAIGDGQVTISHIDTPGTNVRTVDMAEIEVMTYDEIEMARQLVERLVERWELER